jgi:hypothetical protein
MSWLITTIIATTAVSVDAQKRAQKKARKQALQDKIDARKAEVFAETEGQGVGNLGKVTLGIDDEIDPEQELSKKGKSKVRLS